MVPPSDYMANCTYQKYFREYLDHDSDRNVSATFSATLYRSLCLAKCCTIGTFDQRHSTFG